MMIEVNFTPTAKDYAQASRWMGRRNLGSLYWVFWVALLSVAMTAAYGFVMLLDGAVSNDNAQRANQALAGALLFIAALYLGLLLKFVMRRFVSRRTYREAGYFLSARTLTLSESGVEVASRWQSLKVPWGDMTAVEVGKHHLFLLIEPALTLFVPRRIAASPEEFTKLVDYAKKLHAESTAKT